MQSHLLGGFGKDYTLESFIGYGFGNGRGWDG